MDNAKSHDELVKESFSPKARAYLLSETHARGEDLDLMEVLFAARPGAEVLDLGCGGGHVSYLAARHAGSVTAYDLSPSMLEVVEGAIARRGFVPSGPCRAPWSPCPFPTPPLTLWPAAIPPITGATWGLPRARRPGY